MLRGGTGWSLSRDEPWSAWLSELNGIGWGVYEKEPNSPGLAEDAESFTSVLGPQHISVNASQHSIIHMRITNVRIVSS